VSSVFGDRTAASSLAYKNKTSVRGIVDRNLRQVCATALPNVLKLFLPRKRGNATQYEALQVRNYSPPQSWRGILNRSHRGGRSKLRKTTTRLINALESTEAEFWIPFCGSTSGSRFILGISSNDGRSVQRPETRLRGHGGFLLLRSQTPGNYPGALWILF
jgi:hypothetical protein